jgi:hypothetical protein
MNVNGTLMKEVVWVHGIMASEKITIEHSMIYWVILRCSPLSDLYQSALGGHQNEVIGSYG